MKEFFAWLTNLHEVSQVFVFALTATLLFVSYSTTLDVIERSFRCEKAKVYCKHFSGHE